MTIGAFLAKWILLLAITFAVKEAAEQAIELNYRLMLLTRSERNERIEKVDNAFKWIFPFLGLIAAGL